MNTHTHTHPQTWRTCRSTYNYSMFWKHLPKNNLQLCLKTTFTQSQFLRLGAPLILKHVRSGGCLERVINPALALSEWQEDQCCMESRSQVGRQPPGAPYPHRAEGSGPLNLLHNNSWQGRRTAMGGLRSKCRFGLFPQDVVFKTQVCVPSHCALAVI